MKILIVTNMLAGIDPLRPWQGVFVTEQIEALCKRGVGIVDVMVIKGSRGKVEYLKSVIKILLKIRKSRYDIVHYHFGLSGCSAPFVKFFTDAKIVTTFHGSDILGVFWMRAISIITARFSDVCIGVSDEISSRLTKVNRNSLTIPCAVNEEFFFERHEMCHGKREKIIVFPSSPLRSEKNYPLYKQVLALLAKKWNFLIEERRIDGMGREEVRDLLDQAHCLLMTSQREGSPQSVKEAMALNLPVVSVDVGDVRKLLFGVSNSSVVDISDPEILADEVAKILISDRRSNGRQRLKDLGYFSEDVANKIQALYVSLI